MTEPEGHATIVRPDPEEAHLPSGAGTRAVTPADVGEIYRALLGREPESMAVAEAQASGASSLEQLVTNIMNSPERAMKLARPRSPRDAMYDGLHAGDDELMARHLRPTGPEPGFVINFVGSRTRVSHVDAFGPQSGRSIGQIPTVEADYHAEPIEFVGTLRAVEAGSGAFVAVELGAGWGSWSITAAVAARNAGRSPIRLYAVEGSGGKVENMKLHYSDNDFDPARHRLVHAAIGVRDGFALFPKVDVTADWGAEAIFSDVEIEKDGYERVKTISLETLLKDEEVIDLIHFDVQGAESDVVPASADLLSRKVRYLVIGTHSRIGEGRIMEALLARGWELQNEQPAQIARSEAGREMLYSDGTQVWRNKAL